MYNNVANKFGFLHSYPNKITIITSCIIKASSETVGGLDDVTSTVLPAADPHEAEAEVNRVGHHGEWATSGAVYEDEWTSNGISSVEESEFDVTDDLDQESHYYNLIDSCRINVIGGRGGDGCLSFRREKHVPLGGANGGNGGPGGDVYIKCSPTLNTLSHVKQNFVYRAKNGKNGQGSRCNGAKGSDLYIYVPSGTVVMSDDGELYANLMGTDDKIRIARGGRGGKGNKYFMSKFNTAPNICERGEQGISRIINLIYKIPGHIALIGKPNSGKSSILRCLTNAKPKVANYPFSTLKPIHGVMNYTRNYTDETPIDDHTSTPLEVHPAVSSSNSLPVNGNATPRDRGNEKVMIGPQVEVEPVADLREAGGEVNKGSCLQDKEMRSTLEDNYPISDDEYDTYNEEYQDDIITVNNSDQHVYENLVLADIPGLIQGSSEGRGLGHNFLKHIERCNVLSYVIDSSSKDPLEDYESVKREVKLYDETLISKTEIILLNKIDLISNDRLVELIDEFKNKSGHCNIYHLSGMEFKEYFNPMFKSAKTLENIDEIRCIFARVHQNFIDDPKGYLEKINDTNIKMLDDFRSLNPRRFKIVRESNNEYRIISEYLERKVSMMRFDLPETIEKLRRMIKNNGIKDKMNKFGIKCGDILHIGEMIFNIGELD